MIQPFTLITQCFKCLAYKHTSKYCKNERVNCGLCAQEQEYKICFNKTEEEHLKCINWHKMPKKTEAFMIPHSAISPQCPIRMMMIQRQIDRTDYESA